MKYNLLYFFHKDKILVFAFNTGFPNSPCSWIYLFHHSFTSAHQFMHYSSPFPLLSVCIFNFRQFCTLAIFHTISCISIWAKKRASNFFPPVNQEAEQRAVLKWIERKFPVKACLMSPPGPQQCPAGLRPLWEWVHVQRDRSTAPISPSPPQEYVNPLFISPVKHPNSSVVVVVVVVAAHSACISLLSAICPDDFK